MPRHFSELNIDAYRGIKDLNISNLGGINVLVGDNNVGKTSVLEAIQILSDPSEYNIYLVARQREKYKFFSRMRSSMLELFLYMFQIDSDRMEANHYNISISGQLKNKPIYVKINGEVIEQLIDLEEIEKNNYMSKNQLDGGITSNREEVKTFVGKIESSFFKADGQQLTIDFMNNKKETAIAINQFTRITRTSKEKPAIKMKAIQTIDHIVNSSFDALIKDKKTKETAIELLQLFDENITDLRYISDENRYIPVVESNLSNYLPLSMYGDGMKKVLTILNAMVHTTDGIVLIDEFETAVHTSAMETVFSFMISAARERNIQLFLTTHSIEAVDKLLLSAGENIEDVRIITLKRDENSNQTLSRCLNGKEVLEDRKNFDFEVRM